MLAMALLLPGGLLGGLGGKWVGPTTGLQLCWSLWRSGRFDPRRESRPRRPDVLV